MRPLRVAGASAILWVSACSQSNNLLLGRVQAPVGGHVVVVTDCYRFRVPPPRELPDLGGTSYRFTPCRDADVVLRSNELVVNGISYGPVGRADAVTVDHGTVLINDRPAVAR